MQDIPLRIISRIDIKGENGIKGIHLEGLRVIGNPNSIALDYHNNLVDEIILWMLLPAFMEEIIFLM